MSLARLPGETGRAGEDVGARLGQGAVEGGKADVVADRQAEPGERRLRDDGAPASLVGGRFAPALAARQIDVERVAGARSTMVERAGGRTSVPQIFVGGTHVGGCDDLYALDRGGKLDPLLQAGADA